MSKEYEGKPLLLISILNGAFVFMADFCREVKIPCEIAFMCAKSYYSGTVSAGEVNVTMDVSQDISGYHVIIVEDIIDTGRTITKLLDDLSDQGPRSLKVATLLFKPEALETEVNPDYVGFSIPRKFIIGFGLDLDNLARNLNDIYVLNQD